MKTVVFEYRHFFRTFKLQRTIPEKLSEMTAKQFLSIVQAHENKTADHSFFRQFFDLSEAVVKKLDSYLIYQLSLQLAALKDEDKGTSKFLIDKIENLNAPADKLSGITFEQFMAADTFCSWYSCYKKDTYLFRFVATLYLAEGEKWNTIDLQKRLLLLERIDGTQLRAVYYNYALIKTWLSNIYPYLFPAAPIKEGEDKSAAKPKPVNWLNIFDAWVADDVAHINAYKNLPCMDAMRMLNKKIKQTQK